MIDELLSREVRWQWVNGYRIAMKVTGRREGLQKRDLSRHYQANQSHRPYILNTLRWCHVGSSWKTIYESNWATGQPVTHIVQQPANSQPAPPLPSSRSRCDDCDQSLSSQPAPQLFSSCSRCMSATTVIVHSEASKLLTNTSTLLLTLRLTSVTSPTGSFGSPQAPQQHFDSPAHTPIFECGDCDRLFGN